MPVNEAPLNILLVYPHYPDTFWSFRHAVKFLSRKALSPPLGLLTVAALVPKTWKKKLVDLNADRLRDDDIRWADYVFISAMDVQQASVREIIVKVKIHGKRIVAGGPLFTMSPEKFQDVDHFVLQEAEATLPLFIEDLRRGDAKRIYTTAEWPDLTASPMPEWNLLDIRNYSVMNVQFSRGCPFDCDFCQVPLLNGRKPRTKSTIQIIGDLETLYEKGWRDVVFFVDDNFIVKPHRLKDDLLPALIRWMERKKYPFSFLTQASINIADDEKLMKLMVQAGFDSVFIGIESLEEKSLDESHKMINKRKDLMAAVRKIQRFGLQVLGGFIVGFDSDTPLIFQEQVNFIQKSGIVTAMTGILNPLKGTKLYNRLTKEGRLTGEMTGDNTNSSISFEPKMGHQRLLEGYKYIVTSIYSPHYFYERLMTFLRNYNPPMKGGGIAQFSHVTAFLRSVWLLGIWGRERFYFWRTVIWTLFRSPRQIPICVRLAIYGYHFRKVFGDQ